jgi:hypothetical protein
MTKLFLMVPYDLLAMRALSHTDRFVLSYRRGFETFYAKPKAIAVALHLGLKTVEGSITKLRKLGLWEDDCSEKVRSSDPRNLGDVPKKLGEAPEILGDNPEISGNDPENLGDNPENLGRTPENLGYNKSISPMKTEPLLDSILDIRLDIKDKIVKFRPPDIAGGVC